ncbi:MAG: hypothetical protein GWN29_03580, partial [Gammaproteobacteria bacterium]|nr:hypothetical protein [Gammaproteobacteria bacterium]
MTQRKRRAKKLDPSQDAKLTKIVDQLKKRSDDRGYVLHDDINELLDDDFDLENLDSIYTELTKLAINFYDSEDVAREKMKIQTRKEAKAKREQAVKTTIRYDDP